MALQPSAGLWYKGGKGRRTQVAKGAVCKTAIRRFNPARRLQFFLKGFNGLHVFHPRSR